MDGVAVTVQRDALGDRDDELLALEFRGHPQAADDAAPEQGPEQQPAQIPRVVDALIEIVVAEQAGRD